jgi:hypothetical protein
MIEYASVGKVEFIFSHFVSLELIVNVAPSSTEIFALRNHILSVVLFKSDGSLRISFIVSRLTTPPHTLIVLDGRSKKTQGPWVDSTDGIVGGKEGKEGREALEVLVLGKREAYFNKSPLKIFSAKRGFG